MAIQLSSLHAVNVCRMLDAAISPAGRQQLAQTFKLCDVTRLDSKEAVQALLRDLLYTFQGIAQVRVGCCPYCPYCLHCLSWLGYVAREL